MYTREVLGLKDAQAAVEAILEEALKEPDRPVSIAVVDHQGEFICAARMDGATPLYNYMAFKKARSCVTTGRNTRDWLEFLGKRNYSAHDFVPEATRIPGGIVIVKPGGMNLQNAKTGGNGIVLGGIGVSGRTGNEDEALSLTGLKGLQKAVWG